MRSLGLRLLFVLGFLFGLVFLAIPIFLWAFFTRKRPIHFDGVVCRAAVERLDGGHAVGARLHGPAIFRLSGGLQVENSTKSDVLGFALRLQKTPDDDIRTGDQDLICGTFESFTTLPVTIKKVKVDDYLANEYASVTPWRVDGLGIVHLRAMPPRDTVAPGTDRVARLMADIAAGTAWFTLEARQGEERIVLGKLRLVERLPSDGKALHESMWKNGRGYHPTGARNGIRAIVYPFSQAARSLRGG